MSFLYFVNKMASKTKIAFSSPSGTDVTAISLWDNKANAEAYNANAYPAEDHGKIYRGNAQGSDR